METKNKIIPTCGECVHFEGSSFGVYGKCTCEVPVWALRCIDNIAGSEACSKDDTQADECDRFEIRAGK